MREIKFRIWCKQTDEMHAVERMGFEEGELWYVEDENRETDPPYFMDRNDSILMQYTGLKDKNGREIYEGDIYKCDVYPTGDDKDLFTVVWFDTGLVGKQKSSGNHFGLKHWLDKIEVIGNIYEDSHLLK